MILASRETHTQEPPQMKLATDKLPEVPTQRIVTLFQKIASGALSTSKKVVCTAFQKTIVFQMALPVHSSDLFKNETRQNEGSFLHANPLIPHRLSKDRVSMNKCVLTDLNPTLRHRVSCVSSLPTRGPKRQLALQGICTLSFFECFSNDICCPMFCHGHNKNKCASEGRYPLVFFFFNVFDFFISVFCCFRQFSSCLCVRFFSIVCFPFGKFFTFRQITKNA